MDEFWLAAAPAARLAVLRILIGAFALYLVADHYSAWVKIGRTSASLFEPVGVVAVLDLPLPPGVFQALLVACLVANGAFLLGWRYRYTGPVFAALLLLGPQLPQRLLQDLPLRQPGRSARAGAGAGAGGGRAVAGRAPPAWCPARARPGRRLAVRLADPPDLRRHGGHLLPGRRGQGGGPAGVVLGDRRRAPQPGG